MLTVDLAVAKVSKYAVSESGDTVEVVERPHGGLSVVMADGQRSGRSAKAISNIAVRKAISLLAEGVRDGAAARAAHDYLRTQRSGQVSAELTIVSIDLESRTLVISRNGQCPVLVGQGGSDDCLVTEWHVLGEPNDPVGLAGRSRPAIAELPLAGGQIVVAFSDGVLHAGRRRGAPLLTRDILAGLTAQSGFTARTLADGLLDAALAADEARPGDDITVVALQVAEHPDTDGLEVRRMRISFPVRPG